MISIWRVVVDAFHKPGTTAFRLVQGIIWLLIAVSVALLTLELMVPLSESSRELLDRADTAILLFFAVELVLRVASYEPPEDRIFTYSTWGFIRMSLFGRLRYCLQPLMLVDILTVAALVPALRGLRLFRLLRLLRTTRIFRYRNPLEGIARAFRENTLLFAFALSLLGTTMILGGGSIYLIERQQNPDINSLADGIWWALVTLTTVGFGDISPVSGLGRVVGGVLMIIGLFNLAVFAGVVGRTLLHAVLSIREEQFRMSGYTDHIILCGYEQGSRMLLDAILMEIDPSHDPVVVFAEGERPPDVPSDFVWVSGDPTKESELDKVRLTHARTVILVGSRKVPPQHADATTILTAFTIRSYLSSRSASAQRKRPLYVVAEILDAENVAHARTAGADEAIETTRLGFSLLAHSITMPGTATVTGLMAQAGSQSLYVGVAPPGMELPAQFDEVSRHLKKEWDALLIGIRNPLTAEQIVNPRDDTVIDKSSLLMYLAERAVLPLPPEGGIAEPVVE